MITGTSLFDEFTVGKVQIKDCIEQSRSIVLQLFKVEATRLGFAGSTDLQTPVPVPQRDLSFVYLTFNNLRSCQDSKLRRHQRTDINDDTLWITIFWQLCRIILAICSSKNFAITSWEGNEYILILYLVDCFLLFYSCKYCLSILILCFSLESCDYSYLIGSINISEKTMKSCQESLDISSAPSPM